MIFPYQEDEAFNCEDDSNNNNETTNLKFEVYSKINDMIQFNHPRF